MRSKTKKGFTLIELLVVISIIALLLSILMPALTKVKDQARSAVCKSNLKQWGLCFSMYLVENNEKYAVGFSAAGTWDGWIEKMEPYYEDGDLFICPSAKLYVNDPAINMKWGSTNTAWWYRSLPGVGDPPINPYDEPDRVGNFTRA